MNAFETLLLGMLGIGVAFCTVALWRVRADRTESGRRARMRLVGLLAMATVLPIGLFLQSRLAALPYFFLLFGATGVGIVLYIRGGGWNEFP